MTPNHERQINYYRHQAWDAREKASEWHRRAINAERESDSYKSRYENCGDIIHSLRLELINTENCAKKDAERLYQTRSDNLQNHLTKWNKRLRAWRNLAVVAYIIVIVDAILRYLL